VKAFDDLIPATVLIPAVAKLLESIERIPLTLKTHPTQEEARFECCKLLSYLRWITREVKADDMRRERRRGVQMELRLLPP
jgi:hypothetical protein